jgi:hypothetical protein
VLPRRGARRPWICRVKTRHLRTYRVQAIRGEAVDARGFLAYGEDGEPAPTDVWLDFGVRHTPWSRRQTAFFWLGRTVTFEDAPRGLGQFMKRRQPFPTYGVNNSFLLQRTYCVRLRVT